MIFALYVFAIAWGAVAACVILVLVGHNYHKKIAPVFEEYRSHFKYTFLDDYVKLLYPNIAYHPNQPLEVKVYNQSKFQQLLQYPSARKLDTNDYIELELGNAQVKFWDIMAKSTEFVDGKADYQGLFCVVEHPLFKKDLSFWAARSRHHKKGNLAMNFQEQEAWGCVNYQFFTTENQSAYPKYLENMLKKLEEQSTMELFKTLLLSQDQGKLYIGFSHPRRDYEFFVDETLNMDEKPEDTINNQQESRIIFDGTEDEYNQNANFFEPPNINEPLVDNQLKQLELLDRIRTEIEFCIANLQLVLDAVLSSEEEA